MVPAGIEPATLAFLFLFYKYDALPTVLRGLVIYNDIFIYSLLFLFFISFHVSFCEYVNMIDDTLFLMCR